MKTTVALFDQLNSMFNSNENFERCIAMQALEPAIAYTEHLEELIEENKSTDKQLRMTEFAYCFTSFAMNVDKMLENIASITNDNLELLVDNSMQVKYIINQLTNFEDLFDNITNMKGYKINKEAIEKVYKNIPKVDSIKKTKNEIILAKDILEENNQMEANAMQWKIKKFRNLFDGVSKDDLCGTCLEGCKRTILNIAGDILNRNKYIIEERHEVQFDGFPFIFEKEVNKTFKSRVPKDELYLIEIWKEGADGKQKEYEQIISLLLQKNYDIQSSFLRKENDKLIWNKQPINGWVQYLAAFIYVCIENNWIANDHSAPKLKGILMRTFNIEEFDEKPFKSIVTNPPSPKYLKAFSNFPKNEKIMSPKSLL